MRHGRRAASSERPDYLCDPEYVSPWIDPVYVPGPDESHFFCGADPAWTPAREQPADRPDGTCPRCGQDDAISVPAADAAFVEGESVVCAQCQRWGRDARLADAMLRDYLNRGTIEPELALLDLESVP